MKTGLPNNAARQPKTFGPELDGDLTSSHSCPCTASAPWELLAYLKSCPEL